MFPSLPSVSPSAPYPGASGNACVVPSAVTLPILALHISENQSAPCGPATMSSGHDGATGLLKYLMRGCRAAASLAIAEESGSAEPVGADAPLCEHATSEKSDSMATVDSRADIAIPPGLPTTAPKHE